MKLSDDALRQELEALGIQADAHRVIALIPLIQVAWADGRIQAGERQAIHDIAVGAGLADEDSLVLLDKRLNERPTEYTMSRARKALAALAYRAAFDGVTPETLEEVVAYCESVAEAAGGLFGLRSPINKDEKAAITDIAQDLHEKYLQE